MLSFFQIVAIGTPLAAGMISTALSAPLELPPNWKFKTGDKPSWSNPAFDDTGWQSIRTGTNWEQAGFPDYDGYAWYRLHLKVPSEWREDPGFKLHRALRLELGRIDDVDQSFFNGVPVGKTGNFPDSYTPAWQALRAYTVPEKLIRWEGENVIAVRVYDGDQGGGMYDGPRRLSVASGSDLLDLKFDLGEGDGAFRAPDARITATIHNHSNHALAGTTIWTIHNDEGTQLPSRSALTALPSASGKTVSHPLASLSPGFYRLTCTFLSKSPETRISSSMMIGYQPEKISAPLTRESDFEHYWNETREVLAKVAPQFALMRHADRDSKTHEVYEVTMRSYGNIRVAGWYEKPKTAGPHPAVLRVPGYGSSMNPTGRPEPLAIFSFNIRGHGNSQADVSREPVNYWIRGLDDKDSYFYRGAYADCIRAVDFLVARPEIDQKRIAVTGGSQGGGLTLAAAALDQRIALCAPDIPFLCDWNKYFKASHWPEMDAWIEADPKRTWQTTLRTMSYIDTLNLADRIRCPVFFGIGLQDNVCPAATIFSVYNRIESPKEYHLYPHSNHSVPRLHHEAKYRWIHRQFETSKSP